jgi:hypothetical protein
VAGGRLLGTVGSEVGVKLGLGSLAIKLKKNKIQSLILTFKHITTCTCTVLNCSSIKLKKTNSKSDTHI